MELEWDHRKAAANLRKHGIDFADAATVLHDERALTFRDDHAAEDRFVSLGMDALGRLLVVVLYLARQPGTTHFGAQGVTPRTRSIRGKLMKPEYDFSKGERGAPIKTPRGKRRITIRIDEDVLAWFRGAAHDQGGGSYQTLINAALREHVAADQGHLERTLRRVIREELPRGLTSVAGRPSS